MLMTTWIDTVKKHLTFIVIPDEWHHDNFTLLSLETIYRIHNFLAESFSKKLHLQAPMPHYCKIIALSYKNVRLCHPTRFHPVGVCPFIGNFLYVWSAQTTCLSHKKWSSCKFPRMQMDIPQETPAHLLLPINVTIYSAFRILKWIYRMYTEMATHNTIFHECWKYYDQRARLPTLPSLPWCWWKHTDEDWSKTVLIVAISKMETMTETAAERQFKFKKWDLQLSVSPTGGKFRPRTERSWRRQAPLAQLPVVFKCNVRQGEENVAP